MLPAPVRRGRVRRATDGAPSPHRGRPGAVPTARSRRGAHVARLDEIMDQTHHADVKTVRRYVRNARAIRASAAAKLGL
ncbi:hypothetical protein tb265_48650 [Gemmatimonadetes bacterium T265]|nr:hypothetical protein tb265_48650 [Gemmatimonadetes bacterium T265]